MPDIHYLPMIDARHAGAVLAMMNGLYAEDPAETDPTKFHQTITNLLEQPRAGRIEVFIDSVNAIHGYAILIPYWSNELGGNLLFVDELYVAPAVRRLGIARRFFEHLHTDRPFDAVAIALEVSPTNEKARRLYESLGFVSRRYEMMLRVV